VGPSAAFLAQTQTHAIIAPKEAQMSAKPESVIVQDPEIHSGEPVFRGTRVPFQNLLDYLEAGDTLDEFLEQFPGVTRDQAIAALEEAKTARLLS
jgi:uncharacterized protein (DUF433 family)